MSDVPVCGRCGSAEVIPKVRVIDRDSGTMYDLQLEVQLRPDALLFKKAKRSPVQARVCGACGFTELYAMLPRALYTAYEHVDEGATISPGEELARTREALADSHIQLHELEERLRFLEELLQGRDVPPSLPPAGDR